METWITHADQSNFTIYHLPFGIFSTSEREKRAGVAIGKQVIDLKLLAKYGFLTNWPFNSSVFESEFLNNLMALGKNASGRLRSELQMLLDKNNQALQSHEKRDEILVNQTNATMHLPVNAGDYTDFYSSEEHATNVGTMFRGAENALNSNWKHLPVGYHGRSSSIIVSEQNIYRPRGQKKPVNNAGSPQFGPTSRLDVELETAFLTCKENPFGSSVSTEEAEDYIWGITLLNDWSARDIQAWEYVPLGPFLGKSFASSISPWITPVQALEPFRVSGPFQTPAVLPYLQYKGLQSYDINLEIWLQTSSGENQRICRTNHKYLYWNMVQQLAHQTVNGCKVRVGDLYGSGTISGKEPESYGSLLELTWNGEKPLKLPNGEQRTFLEDGDTITLRGFCKKGAIHFGLGEVRAKILPSKQQE